MGRLWGSYLQARRIPTASLWRSQSSSEGSESFKRLTLDLSDLSCFCLSAAPQLIMASRSAKMEGTQQANHPGSTYCPKPTVMRTKTLAEHLESSSSRTAASPRGVPRRRVSSCSSDDSLTLENKGTESKPCAGDVAFNRALAALASQRRHTERQGHRRTRIDNRSDAVGASLTGERKSDDPIGENEDSHSEIHLISMVHSVDSGESSLHSSDVESGESSNEMDRIETLGKSMTTDGSFRDECTNKLGAELRCNSMDLSASANLRAQALGCSEGVDLDGNSASSSRNDLGIYIVVNKSSTSAASEVLLEDLSDSEDSASAEYSSDDECSQGVDDLRDKGRDAAESTIDMSSFEADAQSNPSRSSNVNTVSSQFVNLRLLDDVRDDAKRKRRKRSFSLLLFCIVLITTCSIAALVAVIVADPQEDQQSALRGSAVDQSQSTSTLTDKTNQPTKQPVGVQVNSKSPTTRPSDFVPMPPTPIQNIFDAIMNTASPTISPVLNEETAIFDSSSTVAAPNPDIIYPMAEESHDGLEEGPQFEQVVNVLTRVPDPIESITGCADTGTERYLFDNIITEFMCPPPPETGSSEDPTFLFNIGPSFVDGIRVFAATQCDSCDPVSYRLEGSNDEGKTFFLISMGPFDDDWINQDMPPRRNSKFASTLGGLDRLSFGQVNFTDFDGFVSAQYSQYRLAFTQMRGFDKLMWLGELQLFGSLQVPVP